MYRPIALATAVSGTLDILFAMILTVIFGRGIGSMLRFVASGPFPDAKDWGVGGAVLGLIVHFALMAIMATVFVLAARRFPDLLRSPLKWGVIYGLATYVAMNWIVVPLRFDAPLPPKPMAIATQLFAHVVLVGIPFALIAARTSVTTSAQHVTM
jgi:fluoride ion exporter CrcB/FEX